MEWNLKIICVDDEPYILNRYQSVLSPDYDNQIADVLQRRKAEEVPSVNDIKYELYLAQTGEEAIKIVEEHKTTEMPIAVGFFDMKLKNGIDGLETIRRIKELEPDILCAVVTAYTDYPLKQIATIFKRQDEWIYFNKPFTSWELKQAALNLISSYNYRREKREADIKIQQKNEELNKTIKELKEAQLQLLQSEKMAVMGQLSAGVCHELGQPLGAIGIATGLIKKKLKNVKDAYFKNGEEIFSNLNLEREFKIVEDSVERMDILLSHLRNFSKKTFGQFRSININNVIRDSIILTSDQLKISHIHITTELLDTLPDIHGDYNQLEQVFINLILNACDAMENVETKKIFIKSSLTNDGKFVEILFKDTGKGIQPEIRDKIFDAFFTTKEKGTGLGLSIVKRIIEEHKGSISVEGEVNKGAIFKIILPHSLQS